VTKKSTLFNNIYFIRLAKEKYYRELNTFYLDNEKDVVNSSDESKYLVEFDDQTKLVKF
jgi:hypothetical protein